LTALKIIRLELFINGRDVPAASYFKVRDPGRLTDTVAEVAVGTAEDVGIAVDAAHKAFQSWRGTSLENRIERLRAAANALEIRSNELADLLVREQGMLRRDTLRDTANGVGSLREAALLADPFLRAEEFRDDEAWVRVEKVPVGVVAAIVPWNAPMSLTMGKVGPALAAGNCIVVKPSPYAPVAVSEALKTVAGFFPPGVINIVHGEDDVGTALTHHCLVRKISFTGGTRTGRAVMAAAALSVKNIGLELGGNDPAIVLDDVLPSEIVSEIIKGVFPRSGQVCYAIKRIYVPRRIYTDFCSVLCEAIDKYQVGYGLDPRSTFAPMNNKAQFTYVRELIERARKTGATVRELGSKLDPASWENGYYLRPTVISEVLPDAEIVMSEQFGPVVPVVAYDSEEDALAMANATEYGLGSSIWGRDIERAKRLAQRVEAGMTFINSHARTALGGRHMPFGGMKQSGLGRAGTTVGLAEYVEYHAISLNRKGVPAFATTHAQA